MQRGGMKGHRREPAPINQDASNLAHRAIGCAAGEYQGSTGATNCFLCRV